MLGYCVEAEKSETALLHFLSVCGCSSSPKPQFFLSFSGRVSLRARGHGLITASFIINDAASERAQVRQAMRSAATFCTSTLHTLAAACASCFAAQLCTEASVCLLH